MTLSDDIDMTCFFKFAAQLFNRMPTCYQKEMHVNTAIAGFCMVPPRVLRRTEHRLNMMITFLFVSMGEATVQCVVIGYVSGIDYLHYLVPSFAH